MVREVWQLWMVCGIVISKYGSLYLHIFITIKLFNRLTLPDENGFCKFQARAIKKVKYAVYSSASWINPQEIYFFGFCSTPLYDGRNPVEILMNIPHCEPS